MRQLFYYLIYQEKTKRWLTILEQFEEKQTVTGKFLATKLSCSQRTIQSDIKQIKQYFDVSILLIGGEDGYHFSFQSPTSYTRKKQALIDHEPLFSYADQLLAGTRRTNHEWAETLNLSPASFGRIKRQFVQLLEEQYHLMIVEKDNQLQGSEPAIRQFMYDLYFTLPLCPNVLKKRIESWESFNQPTKNGRWALDSIRLNQWRQLAQWRINQGQCLQLKKGHEYVRKRIAAALDETVSLSFPPQEKAALFLLSLNEEQFVNPLCQKEFIRHFSSEDSHNYLIKEFEDVIVPFFETMIALMNQFFQLSMSKTKEHTVRRLTEEKRFFDQLMKNYYDSKVRLERSLVLSFQLTGSPTLQKWIKKKVRHYLHVKGFYLIEDIQDTHSIRQVVITNGRISQKSSNVVCLSMIPEEKEISQTLKKIDW
ncbi:helix-turn-helix domain containing protein [Enterococcus casseliflavus]|uniref:helix-turn-helix domain containing protein n=1 Tax=Enterococcus casseliflavus TaxID=37734 RepID=UPI00232C5FF4|nr:helix-turn-helix domain containing protein [Enterococcus casseliflavus]MDB1690138.1 helix-turn-helix domain containing protein [Enterococcus casseliflavus]